MPTEAHLDVIRDTTGVWPDPRLVRTKDNPDLARPGTGLVAGCLTIVKVPSVSSHE